MQCAACNADNSDDRRFCLDCGAPLPHVCAACGFANQAGARFCGGCGAALAAEAAPATPPAAAPAAAPHPARPVAPESYTPRYLKERILASREALEGERKQVTVLFADIRGSLELIEGVDAEAARTILDSAVAAMSEAVHRYEGTVNKVLGDGIMALFGAPLAHEDHALRAAYAALAMQRSIAEYAQAARREHGVEVMARVGLHSGEVVVRAIGNDLSMDYDAIGPTVHLASRMEQLAAPGSIRLSADTLRLVEGYVEVEPLGPVPVKGLKEPVEVFELRGAPTGRTRLHTAAMRGLTRFVGRDGEIAALDQARDRAAKGQGQIVAVVADAGVGKSRLYHEFIRAPGNRGWLVLESSSVSYGTAHSWLPVIELLKRYFGLDDRDPRRRIGEKVAGKLVMLDEALKPMLTPLLSLLGGELDDDAWRALEPPLRRRRTLDAVKALLLREAQVQPLMLVFEDLHWIDGETQALLDGLADSLPTSPILLLVNYRPEYEHGWGGRTYYSQHRINPLGAESAGALLSALLGDERELEALKQSLIERTGGTPLFLEESVRTLVESGALTGEGGAYRLTGALDAIEMPATIQAMLAARIDRLAPEAKRLLQCAAVIGKDVAYPVLAALAGVDEDELRSGLASLQAGEFLYETQLFPELEYTFKHALTHEVAYGGLLESRRRELHSRVAEAMEELNADRLADIYEPLASHFERGQSWAKAAKYLLSAAERAKERYTYAEATGLAERALAAAEADDALGDERGRALVLRGDIASLMGNLEAANESYERALAVEAEPQRRQWIANKRHRPHTVTRDGATIAFYEHGDGEDTLLFVNPIVYGLATMQPLLERLCQEFRVITVDLRGTGGSAPLPRGYGLKDHMEDVRAVIEAAGVGSVVGVGISRGSNLLVKLSLAAPALVHRLVLISSPVDDAGPDGMWPLAGDSVPELIDAIRRKDFERLARVFVPTIISEPGTSDLAEQFAANMLRLPKETILGFFALDPEIDIAPLLDRVTVPTLVTQGTADRRVPFEVGQYLAEHIPAALFYAFEGRGHLPVFTATAEFCQVLRQFVREGSVPERAREVA